MKPEETSISEWVEELEDSGRENLSEAIEECANKQSRWATLGSHTAEVPNFDEEESYLLISAFLAGRIFQANE